MLPCKPFLVYFKVKLSNPLISTYVQLRELRLAPVQSSLKNSEKLRQVATVLVWEKITALGDLWALPLVFGHIVILINSFLFVNYKWIIRSPSTRKVLYN